MKTNGYNIRPEQKHEQRTVENMVREVFWNVYRPGCYEHMGPICIANAYKRQGWGKFY